MLGYTQAKVQARGAYDFEGGIANPDGPEFEGVVSGDTIGTSKNRGGFTIGGGVETLLTEDGSVSAKLEYRYTDFKKLRWDAVTPLGFAFADEEGVGEPLELPNTDLARRGVIDMTEHSVRAVISWRFNDFGM